MMGNSGECESRKRRASAQSLQNWLGERALGVSVGHRLSFQEWRCALELTAADLLYLFCTCTEAFCRFWPIEPIDFAKSFENSRIVADRLPPPPKPYLRVSHLRG